MATRVVSSLLIAGIIALITCLSIYVPNFPLAFFGSFGVAVALILLIFVTVGVYLLIDNHKKKMSDFRYRLIFFVALFLIGLAARVGCALVVNPLEQGKDILNTLGQGFQTFYYTIAGIGFEGQDISAGNMEAIQKIILTICYFGSMLWLAASYIVIITAGISYGAYSFFLKIWYLVLGHRSEYYVFTNLTEDTLNLADSIREEKEDKCYIVFAGNELEKFDNSNELHRKVRIRKYPYLKTSRKQVLDDDSKFKFSSLFNCFLRYRNVNRHNSVLIDLGLLGFFGKGRIKNASFHVFALGVDNKLKGLESENSDNVFDDIQGNLYHRKFYKYILDKILIKDNDNPYFHIDYYVLTNNSINYEFYSKDFRRIIGKFEEDISLAKQEYLTKHPHISNSLRKKLDAYQDNVKYGKLKKLFKINLVNEAYLAGQSLIKARHQVERERIIDSGIINDSGNPKNKDHVAIFLGFGQTGQVALNNLYVDTASINVGEKIEKTGIPNRFIAHVYDENIVKYAGQFEKNHPAYLITDVDKKEKAGKELLTYLKSHDGGVEDKKYQELVKKYLAVNSNPDFSNKDVITGYYKGFSFKKLDELMKFPYIYLHKKNCNSLSLLRDLDDSLGEEKEGNETRKDWDKFNSIVIALGDDEDNIAMANALLQDFRQEMYSHYNKEEQKNNIVDIYVNIRNKKNAERLNWHNELEKKLHPNVNVMTFGDADNMYSFGSIINNLDISLLDSNYALTGDSSENFDFVRTESGDISLSRIQKVSDETKDNLRSLMIIEGFVNSIRRKDFERNEDLFRKAYRKLCTLCFDKIGVKPLINAAFTRNYAGLKNILSEEGYKCFRGRWEPRVDILHPLKNEHKSKEKVEELIKSVIKEKKDPIKELSFDTYEGCLENAKKAKAELNKCFDEYQETITYDDYRVVIKNLVSAALLKREGEGYLLTLATFKDYFKPMYDVIASRKNRETSCNRRKNIKSRLGGKAFSNDELFLDISRTQRSFYLNTYQTDSTRFYLNYLDYYDAYLFKGLNKEQAKPEERTLTALERNALAQLEHHRWARYMFARGTIYIQDINNPTNFKDVMDDSDIMYHTHYDDKTYIKSFIKLHKDIVPYLVHADNEFEEKHYLADYLEIYDYLNALCASFYLWEIAKIKK